MPEQSVWDSPAMWTAVGAVLMAFVNSTASVLMLWIRAKYHWSNGESNVTTRPGSASKTDA